MQCFHAVSINRRDLEPTSGHYDIMIVEVFLIVIHFEEFSPTQ
jgi:hypothetical protein